jgi:hypothetical protein
MDGRIAGHTFVNGVCVAEKQDGSPCLRRWVDIQYFGPPDVDTPDIAHVGNLNMYEARQIEEYKQKQDAAIANAFGWK